MYLCLCRAFAACDWPRLQERADSKKGVESTSGEGAIARHLSFSFIVLLFHFEFCSLNFPGLVLFHCWRPPERNHSLTCYFKLRKCDQKNKDRAERMQDRREMDR